MKKDQITKDTLEQHLNGAVASLLDMAKDMCWNIVSQNSVFILSEIKYNDKDFTEERFLRKRANLSKEPKPLSSFMPVLLELYPNLYDINLFIYKSVKTFTVIEIQYFLKTSLDADYVLSVLNKTPMLHSKISIPAYVATEYDKKPQKKFDVNWEHGTLAHKWNMFWLRIKFNIKYPPWSNKMRSNKSS